MSTACDFDCLAELLYLELFSGMSRRLTEASACNSDWFIFLPTLFSIMQYQCKIGARMLKVITFCNLFIRDGQLLDQRSPTLLAWQRGGGSVRGRADGFARMQLSLMQLCACPSTISVDHFWMGYGLAPGCRPGFGDSCSSWRKDILALKVRVKHDSCNSHKIYVVRLGILM